MLVKGAPGHQWSFCCLCKAGWSCYLWVRISSLGIISMMWNETKCEYVFIPLPHSSVGNCWYKGKNFAGVLCFYEMYFCIFIHGQKWYLLICRTKQSIFKLGYINTSISNSVISDIVGSCSPRGARVRCSMQLNKNCVDSLKKPVLRL